jgi:hypothetical protein
MRRKPTKTSDTKSPSSKSSIFNYTSIALLGGVFILGIGIGVGFSNTTTLSPNNIASSVSIDASAPNRDVCIQYGASAMVMDTRLFVTLNPFNVYVAQPSMRPGCVLRTNNWAILEQRRLLTSQQEQECKNRMNTFGWTGELGSSPDISCIYQNDAAKNFFQNQPGAVTAPSGTDKF